MTHSWGSSKRLVGGASYERSTLIMNNRLKRNITDEDISKQLHQIQNQLLYDETELSSLKMKLK